MPGKKLLTVLKTTRLPFLILTPVCIGLAATMVYWQEGSINLRDFILILIAGLFAHISVNMLNEYFDFKSGLDIDLADKRTPFSGGSGVLPQNPSSHFMVLCCGAAALAITGIIGIYLTLLKSYLLLIPGLIGVVLILSYTPFITRNPVVGLFSAGLGFGPVMMIGTELALTKSYSGGIMTAALIPFFLVNNLLLLNQLPDMESDKKFARKTFPIAFGVHAALKVYAIFAAGAYLTLTLGVFWGIFPKLTLIGLGTIPIFLYIFNFLKKETVTEKIMALNVIITLLTPALVGLAVVVSTFMQAR